MAYGRLDVVWPDGQIETHLLSQATVSLGRSSGNTIPLDTDTVSRYHFTLTYDGANAFLTDLDSANGTYLDGVRLPGNEPVQIRGGEEIQIGQIRMNFYLVDDTPTLPLALLPEDTQRIERETLNCRVDVQFQHVVVTPGAYVSVELLITNTGSAKHIYQVEIAGLPSEWVRVNRPSLEIMPDEEALVLMNVKPARRPDTKPGDYQVVVRVRQRDRADLMLEVPIRVTIQGYNGFGAALRHDHAKIGEPLMLHVHNQGSLPLGIGFAGAGRTYPLQFNFNPQALTLAPGQRAQIAVTTQPARARIFGGEREHHVDVLVRSTHLPGFTAALPATVTERPPLPAWSAALLIALIAFGALLVGAGLINLLSAASQPVIETLTVNNGSASVERGEPLNIAWTARNTQRIEIVVEGSTTTVEGAEALEGVVTLDTTTLSGETVRLNVSAISGGSRDTQTREIVIYDPVQVTLNVEPTRLLRAVRQTITVSWEVRGADVVAFDGLEALAPNAPLPVNSPALVTGYPTGDFTVRLRVVDRQGETHERSVNVSVVPLMCTALAADTAVYNDPGVNSGAAAIVQPNTSIEVSGIDQGTGTWLLFTLPGGRVAWGQRDSFVCEGDIALNDLRPLDVLVPTPTIEPPLTLVTPTFTPTATPPTAPTTNPTLLTRTPIRTP